MAPTEALPIVYKDNLYFALSKDKQPITSEADKIRWPRSLTAEIF